MKILTVVGARPQFVKAAVVSRALLGIAGVTETIVHTGQHFDDNMSTIFFDELSIPRPKHNLGVGGGSHASNTGRMMEGIEQLMLSDQPDFVLVYGDTDSTLAAALAAAKLCVKVAHVEAGLRSFNRNMPEEINRIMTDHVSTMLFPPTQAAVEQLAREGIVGDKVKNVGDVMFDAIRLFNPIAETKSSVLADLALEKGTYALCTLHRKENTDHEHRLRAIISGLGMAGMPIVLPLHPRTKKMLGQNGIDLPSNVRIIDPVGYLDMITLQRHASVIGTDSGGLQKEAYFQGVPCVTFRDETEWTELVEMGANTLVGADASLIADSMANAKPITDVANIYGDGNASQLIADALFLAGNRN
jgi:UDP-GlcNAc3NAcA epimerase